MVLILGNRRLLKLGMVAVRFDVSAIHVVRGQLAVLNISLRYGAGGSQLSPA